MGSIGRISAVAMIIIISVVISSCSSTNGILGKDKVPDTDYRSGKEGIAVTFLTGSPPAKSYAGSPFYVVADIKNKGAFDNNPNSLGYIYLHGFDRTAMPFEGVGDANYVKKDIPAIMGKGPFLKEGGIDTVTFEIKQDALKVPYGDKYEPTLMLSTCYRYKTLATPTVCIVPDPSLLLKNKVCEPKTISLISQGAPVAVTKVEEEMMKGTVNFMVTIQNIGDGNVVAYDKIDDCPFNLNTLDKINMVDVTMSMRNAKLLQCQPGNRVRLVDGKGTIFCQFALSETASYTTQLQIELLYTYNSNVKKAVQIAKIPGTANGYIGDPNSDNKLPPTTDKKDTSTNPGNIDNTGSSATASSGSCPCNNQDNCVCMDVNGDSTICKTEEWTLQKDDNTVTITVKASNDNIKKCGIEGIGSGSCPYSENIEIPATQDIVVYGSDGSGNILASDRCTFNIE